MNANLKNNDDQSRLSIPEKLREDIKDIYKSSETIPPEIDRAIIDRAEQHFAGVEFDKTKQRRIRWNVIWKVAAAAAVIIFAFSLDLTLQPDVEQEPTTARMASLEGRNLDIDNNGRVDILDAFTLARRIESVNYTESQCDINNDGLVNRDDVDEIAMAAVRLNKGVL